MSNRAAKYEQLHKSLKKHFKTLPEPGERSVLEHLIYACCLEDARSEQADEAFAKLQQAYFDWNEVRVTTVIELGEALSSLPNATQAGHRIKRCLQSLFEARYQYDVDDLKKANLGKATEEISSWKGISPFTLNYVSQCALGGHAIPADNLTIEVLVQCEILTQVEAEKKSLPGVERAITKNKGFEFGSLLHQFAIEFHQNPKNAAVVAVFKELGVSPKAKVVVKPSSKKEIKPLVVAATIPSPSPTVAQSKTKSPMAAQESLKPVRKHGDPIPTKNADKETIAVGKSKETPAKAETKPETTKIVDSKKKVESKPSDAKKAEVAKKPETKKPEAKKPEAKKVEVKKPETKSIAKKPAEKPSTKKSDAKPAPKQTDKKSIAPSKATKSELITKKGAPGKKTESPKPATSKKEQSANTAKKKPR